MAIKGNMVLYNLANNGIVVVAYAFPFLPAVLFDEAVCLMVGERIVVKSKDRVRLVAIEILVVAAGF